MSRICIGLFLCLVVSLAAPAWASDEKASNKFKGCIDSGNSWSQCSTQTKGSGAGGGLRPNPFEGLLKESSIVGARIWTPSAAERFQGYLARPRHKGY